jgi:hypothetical protein
MIEILVGLCFLAAYAAAAAFGTIEQFNAVNYDERESE